MALEGTGGEMCWWGEGGWSRLEQAWIGMTFVMFEVCKVYSKAITGGHCVFPHQSGKGFPFENIKKIREDPKAQGR